MRFFHRGRWWTAFAAFLAVAMASVAAGSARAALLFSDDFAYANGDLAGNGGGTGWQVGSVWTMGTGVTGNRVANPLPGTSGKSIQIARDASVTARPLSTTYTSGGATTPWDQMPNEANFSFDSVSFAGGYSSGTISVAGLAMADDPNEAVSFTQTAVPEPTGAILAATAAGIGAVVHGRRRRRRPSAA